MTDNPIYARFDKAAEAVSDQVIAWRHRIHQNPELSNREVNTAKLITDHLKSLNLDEVRTGFAGYGVVGVLKGGRPGNKVIALRADIDALPVVDECGVSFASKFVDKDYPGGPYPVSHACGHDCHTAMLMGAATVLSEARDDLPGTVLFVFQPAEEGPPVDEKGGAKQMITEGACDDPKPTMAFGIHVIPFPKNYLNYAIGNQGATSTLIKIKIKGQQVHGSTPWQGIDTMPAAGAVLTGIGQIYRQISAFDPISVSIGHVEDVGRFNIIGETTTLWGTIRCLIESDMVDVKKRIETLAMNTAAAYNCTATVEYMQDVPAVHNQKSWVDAVLPTLNRVAGSDKVRQGVGGMAYDDVSEFINKYGGMYVTLGCQDLEFNADDKPVPIKGGRGVAANHNPKFYADDGVLVTGVRLHANVAYDHLADMIVPTGSSS
ncbi:carboxypeptidase Ss1 [Nocardia tenerifensis]|uniref:Carboxypeptidase Ss1 n=1 Tax=Nocardia tenerifensis TaxID=228006 RepID=A0A318JXE8_9NOCA|nr:amidohydrolase [Nocardia tenerifensis]PXX58421.1 carboxypeptidase Ss1 [Nocardia tenerifensis]